MKCLVQDLTSVLQQTETTRYVSYTDVLGGLSPGIVFPFNFEQPPYPTRRAIVLYHRDCLRLKYKYEFNHGIPMLKWIMLSMLKG